MAVETDNSRGGAPLAAMGAAACLTAAFLLGLCIMSMGIIPAVIATGCMALALWGAIYNCCACFKRIS